MTVQTSDDWGASATSLPPGQNRDASGEPARRRAAQNLEVRAAGEGSIRALNPFENLMLPTFEQPDEYDEVGPSPEPVGEIEIPTAPAVVNTKGVTAGAWGGYKNGLIPVAALKPISFSQGQSLESNATRALESMNAAYRAATGGNIGITDSYRSLAGQQSVARRKPNLAAEPGTSVHGWGKALDLNIKGDPQLKKWLDKNAARFGFVNPDWAKKASRFEPWHWEYVGGGSGGAAPKAKPRSTPAPAKSQALVDQARRFLGTPFKWGGNGPLGFDQAGFTQYVYRSMGINLPRLAYQQATFGPRVPLDEVRPGDLVAWDSSPRNAGADHVAIFIGDGKVIHAPRPGESVRTSGIWSPERAWGVRMYL